MPVNKNIMKAFYTVLLLTLSNTFMTFAWYGHLQFNKIEWLKNTGLIGVILISWIIALAEYALMVPANKIGYEKNGGPFNMFELKTIQEVISLTVFVLINYFVFKSDKLAWNHLLGFALIVLAVFVVFKKW